MWIRGHPRSLKLVPFKSLGAVSYSPSIVTMAISVAVCEIFSIKKWRDLENRVRVRSRKWHHLIDRIRVHIYLPQQLWRYLVSSTRYSDLLVKKSQNFYTPPVFSAPARGDPVGISWTCLMLVKLEWLGYRMAKKLWQYAKPFSSDTGTSRTDGQTDRRTDRQNCYINIARQCAHARYKSTTIPQICWCTTL